MTANTPKPKKTAAKKAVPPKPTTAQEWKKAAAEPVEMPSGNYMVLRKIGMQTLMATGKMPNNLMKIVRGAVDKGTGMDNVDMGEIIEDEKQLLEMMSFMDDLICMVSVNPKVHPVPEDEADRLDTMLYTDEVDAEDKSYVFAYVTGGTTSLEQFRETASANVATLSGRQDLELPAVGATQAG